MYLENHKVFFDMNKNSFVRSLYVLVCVVYVQCVCVCVCVCVFIWV